MTTASPHATSILSDAAFPPEQLRPTNKIAIFMFKFQIEHVDIARHAIAPHMEDQSRGNTIELSESNVGASKFRDHAN